MKGHIWVARRSTWVPIPIAKKEGLLKSKKGIKSLKLKGAYKL